MRQFVYSSALFPLLLVAAVGCGGPATLQDADMLPNDSTALSVEESELGSLDGANEQAAFTDDITLPSTLSPAGLVGELERDRMYMAARPGFIREFTGMQFDASGDTIAAGRYLFRTLKDAEAYKDFLENQYVVDGSTFVRRAYVKQIELHTWSVIGHEDLGDFRSTQYVTRTERFSVPNRNLRPMLKAKWPALRAEARQRGYTGVWLLYSRKDALVSVVYFANRVGPSDGVAPDFASLAALEKADPLGDVVQADGWTRTVDRTSWVFTIWFPFVRGDRGEPALWPYSPPFPMPYAGDGVCEVSRGENSTNAPSDCLPTCGNGVQDPGETSKDCPGDVRLFDSRPHW